MCIWLVCVSLIVGGGQERPFMGVSTIEFPREIKSDGQTFNHGIRINTVTPMTGADEAGLLAGDIIVEMDGVDFERETKELLTQFRETILAHKPGDTIKMKIFRDGVQTTATLDGEKLENPEAWDDPSEFLKDRDAGATMQLTAERVKGLLDITVTLGVAPDAAGNVKTLPPNKDIYVLPVEHLAEEALAEALIADFEFQADYDDLRARLARLVERGDPYRLSRVAYAMREPFSMAPLARQMTDLPHTLPGLLRHAGKWLDHPCSVKKPTRLKTGLDAQKHAEQIQALLTTANEHFERAFSDLTEDERAFLLANVSDMGEGFIAEVMILEDKNRERLNRVTRLVALAAKVDTGELIASAVQLSALLEAPYLAGLRRDLAKSADGVFLTHKTDFGPIVMAGKGNTWHQNPAAVIIDLGGDDTYTHSTQRPFSIVIDLAGDDLYQATVEFSQGSAILGVSMLYDHTGNDRYLGSRWTQGAAAIGVGVLIDREGDDIYRGHDFAQAAAFVGVGLLIDQRGNDRYDAPHYAQAIGMPGGFAALHDRRGSDYYYCSGRDPTGYGTQGVFSGWGQGCGVGFRRLASGGLAVLRDDEGDDIYEGGNFAQGGGYYFGWGALVDKKGSDKYLGARYAQAWAAHQAIGYLEDYEGDDIYQAWRTVGQSCAWDESITTLIDHQGDDFYSGGGFALGASAHNGLAIMIDYAGRDTYQQHLSSARGTSNTYHGGTSLSFIIDFGGATDTYNGNGKNAVVTKTGNHGLFADLPGDLSESLTGYEKLIEK
ncbi:MAG: PDZ domain-containing protein [Planctomycetes bacterium]|nr:PDZ domain-containing protein [Planctomycetota bacterium]